MIKINRRSFVKGAAIGAVAAPLATPALAQERIEMAIVATWGRDFPGLGTGAQRYAETIQKISGGRIQVSYFAAGERVGAFDSFDESLQAMRKVIMLLIITGKGATQVMGISQPCLSD